MGRKVAYVVLGGLMFGVAMAVLKGQESDARGVIGNLSAPWVAVAFLGGALAVRPSRGAILGIAVTMAAFIGFYLSEAAILDLGPHPWYDKVRLAAGTLNTYEQWGVLSGLVYGSLGALWASRSMRVAPLAVALAFLCEPLAVALLTRFKIWGGGGLLNHPAIWGGEVVVGVALAAAVVVRRWAGPGARSAPGR
ncbi:MAG: hypothetical protein QOH62_76 [Solirubrobacteraceae bacterium]|nr:hypothetical protein [Solirubrobacteraceae bacterium]